MKISITGKNTVVDQSLRFMAYDGVPPYTFSLVPDGTAQGTITVNGDSGIYKASKRGTDTLVAVDSNGVEATVEIMADTPLFILCNVIKEEMGLADDQVVLYKQKNWIQNDKRIYISVSILTEKVTANNYRDEMIDGEMKRVKTSRVSAFLDVKIQSYELEALERRMELVDVLTSKRAQDSQFLNQYKIAKIPSRFVSIDEREGPAILYGFVMSLNIQYSRQSITPVEYYDTIRNEVSIKEE